MKLKLLDLQKAEQSLNKIFNCNLPIKYSNYTFKALAEELKKLHETKLEIFKKYGEVNEEGNIEVKKKNILNLNNEINDLLQQEIDINYNPVSIKDIENLKNSFGEDLVLLNTNDWINLSLFISSDK